MIRKALVFALAVAFTPSAALAYGESDGERYSLEERALHFHTDRLRIDPDATDPEFSDIDPMKPLVYNADLNDAARFYAEDMELNGCFPLDHSSCDGTSFGDRVDDFYTGWLIGENIARGGLDPWRVVFEAWLSSPGHRGNMLNPEYQELGPGFAGQAFSSSWWVQDFGARDGISAPVVSSATHEPLWPGPGQEVQLFAAVHDDAGLPEAVQVMVDGVCTSMEPDRGSEFSGTFETSLDAGPQACVPYVIVVTTINGEQRTYPTEGSLLISVDGADCPIWTEDRFPIDCPRNGGGCGGSSSGSDNACSVGPAPRRSLLMLGVLTLVATRRRTARTGPRWRTAPGR
jgi:hypothetical protein